MTYTAVDCQGFAGGFTLGMVQAGFELLGKREHPAGFGAAACEANRHLLGERWQLQAAQAHEWEPIAADVVFGNPPCSGFSVGSNREFRGANSPINHCMWDFAGFVARTPDVRVAAFESVGPAFTRPDGRALMQNLRALVEERTGDTWALTHLKHDAYALGSVQTRRRYFWVITRGDQPLRVNRSPLNSGQTLWDAIGDLEDVPLSWEWQHLEAFANGGRYLRESVNVGPVPASGVDGHQVHDPEGIHMTRVAALLRGDWRQGETLEQAAKRYYSRNRRLPVPWTEAQAKRMAAKDWRSSFWPTVRWVADRPARVIYGGALINAIHPTQPRPLTHREVARIMGFPDTWTTLPWAPQRGAFNYWGKGITVHCGRWLGRQLSAHLSGESSDGYRGESVGDREWLIDIKPSKLREEVLV